MSTSPEHFILFRDLPLMYGRVPKVANSSIKVALCKLLSSRPEEGIRKSADRFWRDCTHGETRLVTPEEARDLRRSHFSFSFVRNPFDRLVAAYNNKLIEIQDVPQPMQKMGLTHGMSFQQFIDCIASTATEEMDNHVRPQTDLLCWDNNLVPKFVGRMEHMRRHWLKLRGRMKLERLPPVGRLPYKNVRRRQKTDIRDLFSSTALVDRVLSVYEKDFQTFYGDYSVDQLLQGDSLPPSRPIQHGRSKAKRRFNQLRTIAISNSINA